MRKPRAFSYLRFSSVEQEKGDSIRRQTNGSQTWCDRNQILLDDSLSLSDFGISAFKGKNVSEGALGEFLEAINRGQVLPGDYLIVESLDRISRQALYNSQPLIHQILSSGINIVTLQPERVFTKTGSGEIGQAIEIIVVLSRAYEESKMKSERVGAAWQQKRHLAHEKKLTKRCASWLELSKDRKSFQPISDRVALVRRIFDLAESYGIGVICKTLNNERIPTFRSDENRRIKSKWQGSTVRKFLTDRAVLGEYQPHRFVEGVRQPVGEPLTNYYPAIIHEDQFNRVQACLSTRRPETGQATTRGNNIFTGLVSDPNGEPFHYRDKGDGLIYLSTGELSVPYHLFATAMQVWTADLDFSMVVPSDRKPAINRIPDLADAVAVLDKQIDELMQRIEESGEGGRLYDMLVRLDTKRAKVQDELETAKIEASSPATEGLRTVKEIFGKLSSADDREALAIRTRLRRALKRIIRSIELIAERVNGTYYAAIEVTMMAGQTRSLAIRGTDMMLAEELTSKELMLHFTDKNKKIVLVDLSKINPSLEKYRDQSETIEKIIDLGKAGLPLESIASEVGASVTKVSKILVRNGYRRITMKPKDHPHVMNWHEAGRGWVKTKSKKRHFIGCGKLRCLYPDLVSGSGSTAEDTWEAANRWWSENHV